MNFRANVVVSSNKSLISLGSIESMSRSTDNEEMLEEKLAGDIFLNIRTTSGQEYKISMNDQRTFLGPTYVKTSCPETIRDGIFTRWSKIIFND